MLFHSLRRALWWAAKWGNEESFFGVFLDTTPKVSNPSPSKLSDPSQKFFTKNIYAPLTPAQFDTPNVSWDVLVNFGRPLWGALLQAGSSSVGVVELCKEKCRPSQGQYGDFDTKTGLLALLSYRIPFTISDFALAENLVSHWMHPLIDVSDNLEQIMVLQPDEPILALAAFQHGMTMADTLLQALDVLDHETRWNNISVGDMGEFVAGLILLLAFDTISPWLQYPRPLPLQAFLKNLLGHAVVEDLLKVPEDSSQSNFGQMLSSGTVFFNRLHRRATAPSTTDIYNMYRTCTACYLPSGLHGVDILIPVWVPSEREREAHIGCILVQVKNKSYHTFADDAKTSAYIHTKHAFKALGFSDQMPVIGLIMCLRGQTHGCEVTSDSRDAKKNFGVILSVGLDTEQYPMFQGPPEEPETLIKQQVLRHLQSMVSEVDTYEPDRDKNAYKLLLFETEFLP
ncbi:hypothetical protein HOO65_010015 [Ceratocystis lukuohia]|uniref:Uncharacterized protein n=1 Tax=Ceratocystis lukuohia TaxID=2019550 RepID=A0ABR4MQW1_9PEZI